MSGAPILVPGRNCWTDRADVERSGVLIDAHNYYRAFYHAAGQARRYILLAGWRFNTDTRLVRGDDARANGGEVSLLPFLARLCRERPDLRVYVLAWDFSMNYALEWEGRQRQTFEAAAPGRIHFRYDGRHAVGGSHHMKFSVVDGRVAFVGGLDFCADDWDDRRHRAHHPDRADSGLEPHGPYHDMQAFLQGPAAAELAGYFAGRWHAATGEELLLPPPPAEPLDPVRPTVRVVARRVALCRNHPRTLADPQPVLEIRQLYADAIAAARELVYLENQYFSSTFVFEALADRLRAPGRPRLDVVIVLPKQPHSWVEALAMELPRVELIERLRDVARATGHRLGVYYTTPRDRSGVEVPTLVHSKLLLIDDRFLTIGSANASNRSMGVDSELNVAWEATGPEDAALVRSIRRVRMSLLAEHCGALRRLPERRGLRRRQGLVAHLDRQAAAGNCRLRPLTSDAMFEGRPWLRSLRRWHVNLDPAEPLVERFLPVGGAVRR